MSLAADVAIAAAERIERTGGAAAGLAVFRRLATNAGSAELRARAILGGIRCATATNDNTALSELTQLWPAIEAVGEEVWDALFATLKDVWRAGLGTCATELAYAEVRRAMTARALHAYARCLDVGGDPRAATAFGDAIARGEKEGATQLVRACRVRRAAWLARAAETLSEGIEEAKRVVSADATPAERLVLARVLLRAPSRFVRAGAIGMLDDVVKGATAGAGVKGSPDVVRALMIAARHADDMQDEITSLEVDRMAAMLSREGIAKELAPVRDVVRAIDRLARAKEQKSHAALDAALEDAARGDPEIALLHRRARDILRGRYEAYDGPGADAAMSGAHPQWTALLDAVVAMRDAAWPRTAHALRRLAELAERGARLPPHGWSVAQAALAVDDGEVRGVASRLVLAMVRTTTAAPPRGWLGLAHALAAAGMDDLATTMRRSAALAKEPGAAEALGLALTRSGWQLARSGERSRAIARLREARALARQGARDDGSKEPPVPPGPRPGGGPTPST